MIKEVFKSQTPRFWCLLAVLVFCVWAFEEIVDDVFSDPLEGDKEALDFDNWMAALIMGLRSERLTPFMADLSALGSLSVLCVLMLAITLAFSILRDYRGLLVLNLTAIGSGLWIRTLKELFGRDRPAVSDHLSDFSGLSFPSGHTMAAASVYFALAYYLGRKLKSWPAEVAVYSFALVLIFTVGITRVYLGVHYATDVLAGMSGGIIWSSSLCLGFEWYRNRWPLSQNDPHS